MSTLVLAYVIVWGAVLGYVAWAGLEQRRLAARVSELEDRRNQGHPPASTESKAA